MKHLFRLLLLLLISTTSFGQTILPLGSLSNTVEVKGGLTVDSALAAPWTAPFVGKGTDINRRLESSRVDSLPSWVRRGLRYKILSTPDSGIVYIPPSQKAAANGVASLDATGKVPLSQLPALVSSGQVYIDNSQISMLSHVSATAGALSVRTDSSNELFVLLATPSSIRANWVQTTYTNAVLAFGPTGNLRTGVVNPRRGDYITDSVNEGPTNLYFTAARAQAQIVADTPSLLATQYYVSTHGPNFQTVMNSGDSTNHPIAVLSTLNKPWDVVNGYSAVMALTHNGLGAKMAIRDSNQNPYTLVGCNVDGTRGQIHVAAGIFGTVPNRQAGFYAQADTTGYVYMEVQGRNVGTLFNAIGMDTGQIYKSIPNGSTANIRWATFTSSIYDTIPARSGTFALTSDINNLGLNSVLTISPNTNQAINVGKVNSLNPYGSVLITAGTGDSSGLIRIFDSSRGVSIGMTTSSGDPNITVQGGSNGASFIDGNLGIYSSNGSRGTYLNQKGINFRDATGLYKHISDSADFSTVPLRVGKLTSASRPYSSAFVGLSGGSDSSGRIVVQDTANATTVTITSASTTAQMVCASATNTSTVSSSTGLTSFHLAGNGTTPAIAAGGASGVSPTISITGTDMNGYITLTSGSATTTGTVATITFATSYGTAPRCVILQAANINAAALSGSSLLYIDQSTGITATTLTITTQRALTTSMTYQYYYQVIK